MKAGPAKAGDLPELPDFGAAAGFDDEDEDEEETPIPAPPVRKPAVPEVRVSYVAPAAEKAVQVAPSNRNAPPPAPEKPKIDCSGVKVGSTLTHKTFGPGTVTQMDSGYMTVSFPGGGEKRFLFPGAIEDGFLRIE